jgi:hypothetical protein
MGIRTPSLRFPSRQTTNIWNASSSGGRAEREERARLQRSAARAPRMGNAEIEYHQGTGSGRTVVKRMSCSGPRTLSQRAPIPVTAEMIPTRAKADA